MPKSRAIPKSHPQPDFQALFFRHFGRAPKRHTYEVRLDTSNMGHDIIFLSSLLDDARLSRSSVRRAGSKVTIRLERDTWERGTHVHKSAPRLHHIASRLTIRGIEQLKWHFETSTPNRDKELSLRGVHFQPQDRKHEVYHLILEGYHWHLYLRLKEYDSTIVLHDTGTPREYQKGAGSGG